MKSRKTSARTVLVLLATVGSLLAAAPAASAATPFTVAAESFADSPNAAIDAAGNAHLAWRSGAGGAAELRYCIVPPGATGCAAGSLRTLISTIAIGSRSIHVFVTPAGKVVVYADLLNVSPSGERGWAWQSTDGGLTFDAGTPITPVLTSSRPLSDAALGPGDALSLLNEVPGGLGAPTYVRGPLTGAAPASAADLDSHFTNNFTIPDGEQVAVLSDSRPVAVSIDSGRLEYAFYGGAGDVNDPANWVGPIELHPLGTDLGLPAMVAGGPAGLVLVYEVQNVSGANQALIARELDPATMGFGGAVSLDIEGDPVLKDLYADPIGGGFHVIYFDSSSPRQLRWVASANGVTWTQPLLLGDVPSGLNFANVAAGPAGTGVVVWEDGGQPGNGDESIMAMRLEPIAEPGGDPCQPPNCVPAGGDPTDKFGNQEHTLEVEIGSCVTRRLVARVRTKNLRLTGRVGVEKVVFRLDKGKAKPDKKRPWKRTFSLKGAAPNSLHTLKARMFLGIKKPNGKTEHKQLKLSKKFRVCPA